MAHVQKKVVRPPHEIIGNALLCRSLCTQKIFLYIDRVKPYVSKFVKIGFDMPMKIAKSGRAETFLDREGVCKTIGEFFEEAHRGNVYIIICGCAEVFRPYQTSFFEGRGDRVEMFTKNMFELAKQAAFMMSHVPSSRLYMTYREQLRVFKTNAPFKIAATFARGIVAPHRYDDNRPRYVAYLSRCFDLLQLNDEIQLIAYSWMIKKLPYESKKRPPEYNLIDKNLFCIILEFFGTAVIP